MPAEDFTPRQLRLCGFRHLHTLYSFTLLHSPPQAAPGAGAGMSRAQITKLCGVWYYVPVVFTWIWNFWLKSFPQRHLIAHLQYFKVFTIAVPML